MGVRWTRLAASGVLAAGLITLVPTSARPADATLGASVDGLRAAGRRLSPALRAAALEADAAAAKADGADALDDPTISDSYQYYRDPGVFSAHTVTLTQAFPLWGKRDLRRDAALADVDAARGRERAAQDEIDEKIKVAFAEYYVITRNIAVNKEVGELARRMQAAAEARYGQGSGEQAFVIQTIGEDTTAKVEAIRLDGEKSAARARLNALVGRPAGAALADPAGVRPMPATEPDISVLLDRARTANPTLSASSAAIAAARTRSTLADKAWYPDLIVSGGPIIQTNDQPVGFSATVGINIPLPWGREASGQQQAAAELAASQQSFSASQLEIEGALGEAVARLRAARATEALLRRQSMPQARAGFQSVLANYRQGSGDLSAAITAQHQVHDVEIRLLQVQLDQQVQLAAIERLIGGDL
jgi:cobalt-zinc-cadmium efflux system outer membrane protein